jgi:hypothetical protein
MPEHLIPEQFCTHDGGMVITNGEMRCADCHAEMVWVTEAYLRSLRREPSEIEQDLRRQLIVKNAALQRIRQYLVEVGIE